MEHHARVARDRNYWRFPILPSLNLSLTWWWLVNAMSRQSVCWSCVEQQFALCFRTQGTRVSLHDQGTGCFRDTRWPHLACWHGCLSTVYTNRVFVGGVLYFRYFSAFGRKHVLVVVGWIWQCFFDKRSKFVHYHPRTLVMNNLEFDHVQISRQSSAIKRQFHHLVEPCWATVVSRTNARWSITRCLRARAWLLEWNWVQWWQCWLASENHQRWFPNSMFCLKTPRWYGELGFSRRSQRQQRFMAIAAARHGSHAWRACEALGSFY